MEVSRLRISEIVSTTARLVIRKSRVRRAIGLGLRNAGHRGDNAPETDWGAGRGLQSPYRLRKR
jgi:hypothetical protein